VILGDRYFLDRTVDQLTTGRFSVESLFQLETDIRWACRKAGRPAPAIAEFFEYRKDSDYDLLGSQI